MKDIRPAIHDFLLGDPTVNALVGGFRIHSVRLPQGQVAPSLVFNRVSETADYTMKEDSGLSSIRIQFDSWAQTADQANELASATRDRLSGYRGPMVGNSEAIEVRGIFVVSELDSYDDVTKLYRISRDYNLWYLTK